jgi:tRNA-modifying protein YgfZ
MSTLDASQPASLLEQLRSARVEGGLYQLPPRLRVRLSGKDAFRYLNGQVTRDLKKLGDKEALPACLLTPKGKLCAPVLISREGEDLLVEADPSLEEALLARLDRYIVADEVTLSVEPERPAFHGFGEVANACSGIRVSRLGVPGVDREPIMGATLLDPTIKEHLFDARVIEALRIERGIPAWGKEMSEETLPPEVGLDRTHIDYDRGCYPGQETISRLKSIGRVRRLLHTLHSSPGACLRPGMRVLDSQQKEIGEITSAAEQWDSGSWVALALLPRETSGPLFALDPLTGETTPISILGIHGS